MDEASFLRAIAESSHDPELVRSFAAWLLQNDDNRGQYLQLELNRQAAEKHLVKLELELQTQALFGGIDSAWLDKVVPLQIVSPLVGRFYAAPTPESDPYVTVGDLCTPHTIIGLIEAMNVFTEIPAETSGVISYTLVSNGDVVDFGRPLFRLSRLPRLMAGG